MQVTKCSSAAKEESEDWGTAPIDLVISCSWAHSRSGSPRSEALHIDQAPDRAAKQGIFAEAGETTEPERQEIPANAATRGDATQDDQDPQLTGCGNPEGGNGARSVEGVNMS